MDVIIFAKVKRCYRAQLRILSRIIYEKNLCDKDNLWTNAYVVTTTALITLPTARASVPIAVRSNLLTPQQNHNPLDRYIYNDLPTWPSYFNTLSS